MLCLRLYIMQGVTVMEWVASPLPTHQLQRPCFAPSIICVEHIHIHIHILSSQFLRGFPVDSPAAVNLNNHALQLWWSEKHFRMHNTFEAADWKDSLVFQSAQMSKAILFWSLSSERFFCHQNWCPPVIFLGNFTHHSVTTLLCMKILSSFWNTQSYRYESITSPPHTYTHKIVYQYEHLRYVQSDDSK